MRKHAGFVIAVASAVLVIGFGLAGIGVAEAQANAGSNADLDLWGNIWFVLGFCAVSLGAVALAASIVMYVLKSRHPPGRAKSARPPEPAKLGPIPGPSGPLDVLIMEGRAMQKTLGWPRNWNPMMSPPADFQKRFEEWSARAQEALRPWPGCYEQFRGVPARDMVRAVQGPMALAYDRIEQGISVLEAVIARQSLGG